MKMANVSLLSAGGTITARRDARGALHPGSVDLGRLLNVNIDNGGIKIKLELFNVLETLSENMSRGGKDWDTVADAIASQHNTAVDGIVVMHGTDTMQYTTAAISFLLPNLQIPVAFTGTSKPILEAGEKSADANNLRDAILVAAQKGIKGVIVVYGGKILSGTNVQKMFDPKKGRLTFESINQLPLGRIHEVNGKPEIRIGRLLGNEAPHKLIKVVRKDTIRGGLAVYVKVVPDIDVSMWEWYLQNSDIRAILLELYGSGTACVEGAYSIMDLISKARTAGKLIFGVSSAGCPIGMNDYETSRLLRKAGVIPLGSMTPSVAWVKLRWALSKRKEDKSVIRLMTTDVAGELDTRMRRNC